MQTRPYAEKEDGARIWLSRDEQRQLLDVVDDHPRKRIALGLGLHGLRTDEITSVTPDSIRGLPDGETAVLQVDGKTGAREVPIRHDMRERIKYLKAADSELGKYDPVIDVSNRSVRNWIDDAAESMGDEFGDLSMHDLRRTWATDTYYSLAYNGVPIAETITMIWGGWALTETGRQTFNESYLGTMPDHITQHAVEVVYGGDDD